jgi:hypothetical protein
MLVSCHYDSVVKILSAVGLPIILFAIFVNGILNIPFNFMDD